MVVSYRPGLCSIQVVQSNSQIRLDFFEGGDLSLHHAAFRMRKQSRAILDGIETERRRECRNAVHMAKGHSAREAVWHFFFFFPTKDKISKRQDTYCGR